MGNKWLEVQYATSQALQTRRPGIAIAIDKSKVNLHEISGRVCHDKQMRIHIPQLSSDA